MYRFFDDTCACNYLYERCLYEFSRLYNHYHTHNSFRVQTFRSEYKHPGQKTSGYLELYWTPMIEGLLEPSLGIVWRQSKLDPTCSFYYNTFSYSIGYRFLGAEGMFSYSRGDILLQQWHATSMLTNLENRLYYPFKYDRFHFYKIWVLDIPP